MSDEQMTPVVDDTTTDGADTQAAEAEVKPEEGTATEAPAAE